MTKHPSFIRHAEVWALGPGVFAVPRYDHQDAIFGHGLVALVGTHLAASSDVLNVISAQKYVTNATTGDTTTCPTSTGPNVPPLDDEICRRHPPFNDSLTEQMTLVVAKGQEILKPHANELEAMSYIKEKRPKETCFWLMKTDKNKVYTVAFS